MVITLDLKTNNFHGTFNGEEIEPYYIPDKELIFDKLTAAGDIQINHLGFSMLGMLISCIIVATQPPLTMSHCNIYVNLMNSILHLRQEPGGGGGDGDRLHLPRGLLLRARHLRADQTEDPVHRPGRLQAARPVVQVPRA